MVVSGGVGVVAVVAFVSAVAFGAQVGDVAPGARLGLTGADGPLGLALLVPRCQSERVLSVELRDPEGTVVWRVVSEKGAIEERYVIGAGDVPFATDTDVRLDAPLPPGELTAAVSLSGDGGEVRDWVGFDPASVPADGVLYQGTPVPPREFEAQAAAAADCGAPGRRLGLVTWMFVAAALGVVVTYVMMLGRYLDGRSKRR